MTLAALDWSARGCAPPLLEISRLAAALSATSITAIVKPRPPFAFDNSSLFAISRTQSCICL